MGRRHRMSGRLPRTSPSVAYNAWMRHSLSAARRQQPRAGQAARDGAARGFGLEAVFAGRPGSYWAASGQGSTRSNAQPEYRTRCGWPGSIASSLTIEP